MTTRPTVDITVDAADAPMLAALAKRRDYQRALGHEDDERMGFPAAWSICRVGEYGSPRCSAARIKRIRSSQEHEGRVDGDVVLMGEIAEVLEAETDEARIYELLDVAAVCLRIASKMQRDLDARDST